MGEEGKIIEFYSANHTIILWNLDDYPVPSGTDLSAKSPIRSNFYEALRRMGFHGFVRIDLHCEQLQYDRQERHRTRKIVYLPEGTPKYNVELANTVPMTYHILLMLENSGPGHYNAAVIAKPYPELLRVLGCLESRGHNVVLIEPPPYLECFFSVEFLVDNALLIGRGMPRAKEIDDLTLEDLHVEDSSPSTYKNVVEDEFRPSKEMVDFSVRTKHVTGDRTVIFWDAVDSPFPRCFSSPKKIFAKIKSALLERNFSDKVSIWVYVEKDSEFLKREKTWFAKIYFLPGDNDASLRRIRMFNDIQLLSRDSPVGDSEDASLMLVSDQFMGNASYMKLFDKMKHRGYFLALIVPSKHSEGPAPADQWPGLLLDEASYHLKEYSG